jgi:hypothetical protein
MTNNLKSRVPHLRDGFIVAKVGIARKRDRIPQLSLECRVPHISILMCGLRAKLGRLPFPTPKARHPERSSLRTLQAAQSKDPDTLHLTKTDQTLSPRSAVTLAVAVAVASRYPKASALGLSGQQNERGFSPWGMLSSPSREAHA